MKVRDILRDPIQIEHDEILDAMLDMGLPRPPKDLRDYRSKYTPHQGTREMERRRRRLKKVKLP